MHGDYGGFTPKKKVVSSLEGKGFLLDASDTSVALPWYDSKSAFPEREPGGTYRHSFDPGGNLNFPVRDINIKIADSPLLPGAESMSITIGGVSNTTARVL